MREIEKILNQNERIIWEGAPEFHPFVLGSSLLPFVIGFVWVSVFLAIFFGVLQNSPELTAQYGNGVYGVLLLPHFWGGLICMLLPLIYSLLVHRFTYYAITDKRIIFQKGVIGRDFDIIDLDQITNATVNVGLVDKLFGDVGSIYISTAGSFIQGKHGPVPRLYGIRSIKNPYEVFKHLKQTSHDVKTDIEYPNALRPKENTGYQTEYSPQEENKKPS